MSHLDELLIRTTELHSLEEVVVGLTHELNNPLTSVQGLARLLTQGPMDDSTAEDLELIAGEAERAAGAVRALRDLVGPLYQSQASPVDFAGLVETVVRARRYEIEARGISLEVDASVHDTIVVNRRALTHLTLGMLLQAEKAAAAAIHKTSTGDRPSVEVEAAIVPGGIRLEVTDTGAAVPTDERDALLERSPEAVERGPRPREGRPARLGGLAALAASLGGGLEATHPEGGGLRLTATLPAQSTD